MSDHHWTIEIKFDLARDNKRAWTPDVYKAWRRELYARIPKRNNRPIYYRTEVQAKKAFKAAGLDDMNFEICKGFFLSNFF